ncbi:hypothetical protein BTO06_09750 [Tenacibaculum sp. SZ-18]|uniref:DUF5675 family protein n=1 Tax=Tenacibaculum sp. SZ-18 TaxID=754423 RepID=UPI000C2CF310|nr:DUF5675 family protein [Tenacibaculum sp. SZ-18]AUC15403.1 hypothetical protein BTO06_09750 [Tenacibaculum sp. SZ-18]
MKLAKIEIVRKWQDNFQSSGTCTIYDADGFPLFSALSLERGWRDNKKNISCIPEGIYPVVLEHSTRFKKKLWEIKDVPNRSECKFHSANYWHQLNGCIALGFKYQMIDTDNYQDVSDSKMIMDVFHITLGKFDEVELHIINDF